MHGLGDDGQLLRLQQVIVSRPFFSGNTLGVHVESVSAVKVCHNIRGSHTAMSHKLIPQKSVWRGPVVTQGMQPSTVVGGHAVHQSAVQVKNIAAVYFIGQSNPRGCRIRGHIS